ncbi:DNA glycosylase AlkZ-like family protein, partial [Salmonella enterica]
IIPVEVETLGRMWLHADLLSQLEPALNNALKATHSAVLSPFDPVVWDRKRAAQLFGFNYRLECYTPAAKRQYGYFVLPLLYRGRLVGRMDAKMHRKTGVLEVISLYLEDDIRPGVSLQKGIWQAISAFAAWQRASRVTLGQCPPGLFSAMRHGWEIDPAP